VNGRAVFLDRDGVLVEDAGPLVHRDDVRVLPGVVEALGLLHRAGWIAIVVSNQTVVARGLLGESEVRALHHDIEAMLAAAGAPPLAGFFFCPHHPNATRPEYRAQCSCRKPEPGLILRACSVHDIDPTRSVMVGDRPSDVAAGQRAGCRAVWLHTGRHHDAAIETAKPFAVAPADRTCSNLLEAARWIAAEELA
jgi:D-glycero-D-manno-heptose 1,7-bisphosphate phosphatase